MIVKIGAIVRQVALIALLAAFLEMLLPEKKMTRYVRLVLGLFVVVAILSPLVEGLRTGPELDVAAWDLRLDPVTAAPVQQGREMAAANEEAALELYRERLAGQIRALVTLIPGIRQVEVLVRVAGEQGYRGTIQRVVVTTTLTGPGERQGGSKEEGGGGPPLVSISPIEVKPGVTGGSPYQPAPEGGDQGQEQQGLKTGTGAQPGNQGNMAQGNTGQPAPAPRSPGSGELPPANPPPAGRELRQPAGTARPPGNAAPDGEQIKARIREMVCHFYGLDPGQVEVIVLPGSTTGKAPSGGGDGNGAP